MGHAGFHIVLTETSLFLYLQNLGVGTGEPGDFRLVRVVCRSFQPKRRVNRARRKVLGNISILEQRLRRVWGRGRALPPLCTNFATTLVAIGNCLVQDPMAVNVQEPEVSRFTTT